MVILRPMWLKESKTTPVGLDRFSVPRCSKAKRCMSFELGIGSCDRPGTGRDQMPWLLDVEVSQSEGNK